MEVSVLLTRHWVTIKNPLCTMHEKHLKIAIEIGDRGGEGANLGNCYQSLGDCRKSIEYHEKQLKIAIEIVDRSGEGKAYGSLDNSYQALGDYQKAIDWCEKLVKIAVEIGYRPGEGKSLWKSW